MPEGRVDKKILGGCYYLIPTELGINFYFNS